MKFMLDGCDIAFVAEAPEDITLKQLLQQIVITYDDVQKVDKTSPCTIAEKGKVFEE